MPFIFGADTGIRTRDLVLTKDVLYLLSHISKRINSRQRYLLYLITSYFATVFRSVFKFILEKRFSSLVLSGTRRKQGNFDSAHTFRLFRRHEIRSTIAKIGTRKEKRLNPHETQANRAPTNEKTEPVTLAE